MVATRHVNLGIHFLYCTHGARQLSCELGSDIRNIMLECFVAASLGSKSHAYTKTTEHVIGMPIYVEI